MKRPSYGPRLGKEQILEAANLQNAEARLLAADYYAMQDMRKGMDLQLRHAGDKANIPAVLRMAADTCAVAEADIAKALTKFAEGSAVGRWALAQVGVGGIITAGLLAHIDITRAPTVGHIWSFAKLNPEMKWAKGQKRPFNAALKQLTYHLRECFKRTSNHPDSFYGKIYRERKAFVVKRNDEGYNAERAKTFTTKSKDVRAKLAEGKLPDSNLDAQAGNYAVKIFLSHLHAVMYWDKYGKAPPKPFVIQHLGHVHEIKIPNLEMFPGLEQAYYGAATSKAA